nr:MAG: hypothetical protein CM15mV30_0890 [uncultured marine virus]
MLIYLLLETQMFLRFHDDLDDVYIWQCYRTTDWEVPKYNIQNTLLPVR